MKTRTVLSTVVAVLATTGCNSLNVSTVTIHNRTENYSSTEVEVDTAVTAKPPAEAVSAPRGRASAAVSCPIFKLPALPPIPALPIQELEKIGPQGGPQVLEIERKHIKDLRQHSAQVRELIGRAYAQYLAGCRQIK